MLNRIVRNRLLESAWWPTLAGLAAFLLGALVTSYAVQQDQVSAHRNAQAQTLQFLTTVRARIEGELLSTLYLGRGLSAYVATHPDITQEKFQLLAAEIVAEARNVRNIALARDNVITHMHPLSNNRSAIGLDYRKQADQWPAVERAMRLGSPVLAGPVDLVQGGQGLIARTPIYLSPEHYDPDSDGKPRYWGIASLVIDLPQFVRKLRLTEHTAGYTLALRGRDADGKQGGVIFGDPNLFESDAVLQEVYLPDGSWLMAARPSAGWVSPTLLQPDLYLGLIASALLAMLCSALAHSQQQIQALRLHDQHTGLPNRTLLEDRMQVAATLARPEQKHFFILLWVQGRHELLQEYGQQTVDQIWREIAQRLLGNVSRADTVAHLDDDQFVILLLHTNPVDTIEGLLSRLSTALNTPFFSAGKSIHLDIQLGCAEFPGQGIEVDSLLKVALSSGKVSNEHKVTRLTARRPSR